jgi:hypothetical protein
MRKKKPARKKPGKKKSAAGKKAKLNKKPIRRKKRTRSKAPGQSRYAQIHQGVGSVNPGHSATTPEIPDDAAEYGGES